MAPEYHVLEAIGNLHDPIKIMCLLPIVSTARSSPRGARKPDSESHTKSDKILITKRLKRESPSAVQARAEECARRKASKGRWNADTGTMIMYTIRGTSKASI